MALTYSLSKLDDDIHKFEKPYMTIPLRSMINTPSTPLCEEIRAIVSSISAAVDDSTAASLEELISVWSGEIRTMTERPSVGTALLLVAYRNVEQEYRSRGTSYLGR